MNEITSLSHERGRRQLTAKIDAIVTEALWESNALRVDWVVQQVMSDFLESVDENSPDWDLRLFAIHNVVRSLVVEWMNRSSAPCGGDAVPQLYQDLGHFDRIQERYVIKDTQGVSVAKRLEDMSRDEILIKAQQYSKMADGIQSHAAELQRYVVVRDHQSSKSHS